jgi:hypothetical protein
MVRARAVIGFAIGLLAACAGHPLPAVTPAPVLRNGPAETGCFAGAPLTVYRQQLSPDMRAELEVHEAVHRQQLAISCDSTLQAIVADRHRYAEAETEAGCAQLEAVTAPGRHALDLGTLSGWLQDRFPDLPADTLNALIARRCGGWRPA